MEKIIHLDKQLFVFLNGLGSEQYDGLWLLITKQFHWAPVFLFVFYLLYKKLGWKHLLLILIFIAVTIAFTDQFTNLVKNNVQRLRPCNDLEIKNIIRIVKASDTFSYFSGHAANSMATTVLVFSVLKKYYRYAFLLFLFPLIFAYSRIYLGLHFPGDILSGYIFGALFGFGFSKMYFIFRKIYFPDSL
ncbi:membrane-associated phospholipid phosphatase [Flavobacterium limnosediminis JC2902]|uniref:Membrane-associated phospholipid phosphatase n=1 Tax=Flavobacterium limnosediminis JC2902 TaxID=1341181 RepID=V6STB1_9FLAO|nr:phosphatase PAP2 family protein [Flavobacterium limnosediminis]ESU29422.1 membrane-associated phospholipid phosphatase [Flavobacterium limnosediminis JC2902]